LLAGAVALLGGCALPNPTKMERLDDIPEAMVAQLDAMPVLQDDRVPRVSIEEVEGVSCRRAWKGMPASWDDAVQKGANAIADLSCERPQGRSFTTMCFESIRCTARAVKIGH